MEISEILNKDTWGLIDLDYMAGVLPSYTKLGMASLLPHKTLEYKEKEVFVDGINSEGLENRKKILQNNCLESFAIRYEDFMKCSREEARELVKGKKIFYIYHNKIDSTEDKQSSETVFSMLLKKPFRNTEIGQIFK